jgi:PAS domain S-box-containing protein
LLWAQTADAYRLLVDSVRDYAIFLLDPQGRILSWNAGAERIKGCRANEIIGQHFSAFYLPADVAAGKCDRELASALRDGSFEDEGWRVRKDGSHFWASVVITALHDRDGRHVGFAKVTRDLTDRSFRAFVEATNAIVWTTDPNGRPNKDSPSWRAFTGQTVEEWLGLQAWLPVHPDDQQAVRGRWAKAKTDKHPFEAEFRLRRRDGHYVWMACRAVLLLNDNGGLHEWFGVTFDISARKKAEEERERALNRWTTTLNSIGDAVMTTDVSGRVTFANPVATELLGVPLAEASGKPLGEVFCIVNEETRKRVENPVERVLREGKIVGLANHTVLVRRDGTDVPIDDSAAPIRDATGSLEGVVLVFRDVGREKREQARRTFLARAGEALMTSVDYREALATVAQLAVPRLADWCAVDIMETGATAAEQLAVAHVDPGKVAYARELGKRYPPDPNATNGVPQVIRSGRSELYPYIPREMLEGAAVDAEHLLMIRELQLRSAMIVPLTGKGRVFGALTFVYAESGRQYTEDDLAFAEELARRAAIVIERKRLEDERLVLLDRERMARSDAERANRAKDEFLATVSHELRTPLNAILGWAAMMRRKGLPKELERGLGIIERNAQAQARLIEDMLDVSRIISGKLRLEMGTTDLQYAIGEAVEVVRPGADTKGVALSVDVESEIGTLVADPERIQQVVWNLLSNAVKFTPKGGQVHLEARRHESTVTIAVSDTGKGIAPAVLPTIFEPFRQGDASTTRLHGGLGLGLAIARQLVQAHGGTIRAESAGDGKGAKFTVELPSRSTPTFHRVVGRPLVDATHTLPRLDGLRVLVVDDEPDARELLREALANAGAQVEEASSSAEAQQKLRSFGPDVLVSDIGMPEEDGYTLLRKIRALPAVQGGRTQALALTAYASEGDQLRAFAAGFQTHMAKPVRPGDLVTAVANLAGVPLESP